MTTEAETPVSAALDPISRISEVLFGLIMVLTFTGSLSAATAGREDIREMLVGALGCNFVWGLIDALLFLMGTYTARGRNVFLLKKLKAAPDPAQGHAIILEALPEKLGSLLERTHLEHLRVSLLGMKRDELKGGLSLADLRAAFFIFGLVFLSVFPVAAPFLVMSDPRAALRTSHAIAIAMLFGSGCSLAHYTGGRTFLWGATTAVIGIAVALLTIALGG